MIRARDLALATLGLLILWPLMLLIAVLVRLDSSGPAVFRQQRVGLNGRPFRMHKFRTMAVRAAGPAVSTSTDVRVTRVGRTLRATKLDELPQLWDVVRGSMSLVGPRPEVAQYVDRWPGHLRHTILSVRPGITDPATVLLRHEAAILSLSQDPERTYVDVLLPAKAGLYCDYVRTRSFWRDFGVVFQTLREVVRPADSDPYAAMRRLGLEVT